jgi:hypothetical protein
VIPPDRLKDRRSRTEPHRVPLSPPVARDLLEEALGHQIGTPVERAYRRPGSEAAKDEVRVIGLSQAAVSCDSGLWDTPN